ncbi:dihydrofolate synthase/folylpolyglutamate synthase [Sedimentibacter acidaminivorans]|uniref:tetrahydrofolate synthase n=1 Tax=Sedimentibacter acidaminivorans TaxID=913099 RepID=A0ABS4GHU4_9FIRM|nr:folylpolyglutamate synthase/dihydrofolate synthase family protein [Sedimentibacter acidaminivorans]MBP1927262.1 dihydrofolate synthase/folylpolyglutamate synthase [Sedimentibacter acidaminivorans]
MNYEEAIDFIHSTYKFGSKLGLDNITKLTELLGNPQDSYKIIHIAGTNGKGSTSNMIHDVLVSSGYKTGLFISPYLEEFTERIQINKIHIDKESLAKITTLVKEKIDIMISEGYNHPTEFEVVTAIGFKYFEEQKINFLVLEVGLGGRFDATNVVKNTLVSIITSISYDHMQYLGNTLEKIAFEKAGIIKRDSKVIIYPQSDNIKDVVKNQAKLKNSEIYEVDEKNIRKIKGDITGQEFEYLKKDVFNLPNLKINLLGEHQLYNAATALCTLEVIKKSGYNIDEHSIEKGFINCKFAGRFEIINKEPIIILDGGHNINGIEYFSKAIKEYFGDKKIILFYGMLEDKNPDDVIDYLVHLSKEIYTLTPNNPRAMSSNDMAYLIRQHSDIKVTPIQKYNEILNILNGFDEKEVIAFVGSLYMIGEVRTLIKKDLNLKN